jgi:4,5-dihydroxyphthalate decarboxylase
VNVHLTLGMSYYDHTADLSSGKVRPTGVDLTVLEMSVEEIFYRFGERYDWDISEMPMGRYISMVSRGDRSLVGIPVFPSRMFRHSSIFVRRDANISGPEDLRGARVGVPEWSQTAAIYSRGMLRTEYGVELADVQWVQAGVNDPGRRDVTPADVPAAVQLTRRPDRALGEMLVSGELEAVMSAHAPKVFEDGHDNVVRLFPDYQEVERAYFAKTGVFPIMHTVVVKREVVDRHPWVPVNLFNAFREAKERSVARLKDTTASRLAIPGGAAFVEQQQSLFVGEYWPYGVESNRPTLEAFARFAYEQGVASRELRAEELFDPSVLEAFKV